MKKGEPDSAGKMNRVGHGFTDNISKVALTKTRLT